MARKPRKLPTSETSIDQLVQRAEVEVLQEETDVPMPLDQTTTFERLAIEEGHNPRKEFPEQGLRDLAGTIEHGGLIQPLTVRPREDRPGHYFVVAGERRYRAIALLIEEDRIDSSFRIPIYVRSDFDERSLRLIAALVENLQKEPLSPLEEAEAFADLRDGHGLSTADIADRVAKTQRFVQQRLALLNLSDAVRSAIRSGEMPVSVARKLSTAPPSLQDEALERYRTAPAPHRTEEAVLKFLRQRAIPFTRAVFDPGTYVERGGAVYTSESTDDRGPGPHNSYFADTELFLELQTEAIENERGRLAQQYDWIDEVEASDLPREYEATGTGPGAVILWRQGLFDVLVFTGVSRTQGEHAAPKPLLAQPSAPPTLKEEFVKPPAKPRLARAARERNRALQNALATDSDTALLVALVALLTGSDSVGLRLSPPPRDQAPAAGPRIERALRSLAEHLDVEQPLDLLTPSTLGLDEAEVYRRLRPLPSGTIQALLAALVSSAVGVFGPSSPSVYSPPFVYQLAGDLQVSVDDWRPDADYIEQYTTEELRVLAERFSVHVPASARKEALVEALLASEEFLDRYRAPELAFREESTS